MPSTEAHRLHNYDLNQHKGKSNLVILQLYSFRLMGRTTYGCEIRDELNQNGHECRMSVNFWEIICLHPTNKLYILKAWPLTKSSDHNEPV
jgi:hypothetical protein